MPIPPEDRPLDALRTETVDQLVLNYGHGKLSLEAFERRLDQALDAKSHEALTPLTADLESIADRGYARQKERELGLRAADGAARDVEHLFHVFSGTNRRGAWNVAKEIRMFNVFGGAELDFSDARFSARTTHIKMFCIFGGATLYVPEDVNTTCNAVCIFGGIDNRAPYVADPGAPQIVIEGLALFGGASIRVKKTLKERLVRFADTLRDVFGPAAQPRSATDRPDRRPTLPVGS